MSRDENLIYDVGLHTGEDTAFYLAKGFRVVAVEANPELAEKSRSRFADEIADGTLTVLNVAVAAEPGPVTFYANAKNTAWGTTDPEWAQRNATQHDAPPTAEITVRGARMQDLLVAHGVPYFCKIDVEGADLTCLLGFHAVDARDRPEFVSIEADKRSWSALLGEFDELRSLGYTRFKVVNQREVPRQRAQRPTREGTRYVETHFEMGASGLFGEEAPGQWLTRRQALVKYAGIFFRYRMYGEYGWFRRRPGLGRIPARLLLAVFGSPAWFDTHAGRPS